MSDVKWVRLTIDMFNDEKIKIIEQMPEADTILIIWIKLLAQAGKTNASGYIFLSKNIPYTEEMLATIFDRPLNTMRLALNTLQQFGMIDIDENSFISINNWEKHQNEEGLARIRKQTNARVRKHRQLKKIEQPKAGVTLPVTLRNATELELELELELERDTKKNNIRDLFDHYLSKNIINHSKMTSAMRSAVNARLKDYSYDQLVQAIDNYSTVYKGDGYFFNSKYGFADLMRDKDIRKFIDEADPLNNLKDSYVKANPKKIDLEEFDLDD